MHSFTTLLVLATAAVTSAQIDPNSVDLATRQAWCRSQQASCPLLCLQQSTTAGTRSNTCVAATLSWTCVCMNGLSPNLTEYSQTVPYYICEETGNQCVKNCGLANNACASNCREQHPCGALDPTRVNVTSSTSSSRVASATASTTGSFGTFGGSSSSSSSSGSSSSSSNTKANAAGSSMVDMGKSIAVFGLAGGLFAAFAVGL